jgi:hypothetical protein
MFSAGSVLFSLEVFIQPVTNPKAEEVELALADQKASQLRNFGLAFQLVLGCACLRWDVSPSVHKHPMTVVSNCMWRNP